MTIRYSVYWYDSDGGSFGHGGKEHLTDNELLDLVQRSPTTRDFYGLAKIETYNEEFEQNMFKDINKLQKFINKERK